MSIGGGQIDRDNHFRGVVQPDIVADPVGCGFATITDMGGDFGNGIIVPFAARLEGDKDKKQEAWQFFTRPYD